MMTSGSKYENWFSSRIEELVNQFADKQTILAFAGLSPVQATLLSRNVNALDGIVSSSESDVDSYNPFEFSEKKKKAFFDIAQSDGVVVCLYEQLVVLRESLHNLYDGRIVVVEDNLFLATEGYPSPVSENLLAKWSAEFDSASAESSPLSSCYAKIEKCNENYVVTLIDYARDMGWKKTNLYDSGSVRLPV